MGLMVHCRPLGPSPPQLHRALAAVGLNLKKYLALASREPGLERYRNLFLLWEKAFPLTLFKRLLGLVPHSRGRERVGGLGRDYWSGFTMAFSAEEWFSLL